MALAHDRRGHVLVRATDTRERLDRGAAGLAIGLEPLHLLELDDRLDRVGAVDPVAGADVEPDAVQAILQFTDVVAALGW